MNLLAIFDSFQNNIAHKSKIKKELKGNCPADTNI